MTRRFCLMQNFPGRQPLELERPQSLSYSFFNLEALMLLARFGEQAGVDLWAFSTADGRSLKAAVRYIAPFARSGEILAEGGYRDGGRGRILPLLAEAARHGDDPSISDPLTKFSGAPSAGERWRLWWTPAR